MSASIINRDEWLHALAEAGIDQTSEPDAVTVAEFAAMLGVRDHTAARQLQALEQAGKAKRTRKRSARRDGRMMSHVAYVLVAQKPKKHSARD